MCFKSDTFLALCEIREDFFQDKLSKRSRTEQDRGEGVGVFKRVWSKENQRRNQKFNLFKISIRGRDLRRLERVFRCYIACETMEDYKEGCLMVWANYMSPCNSTIGLYFKGTCDVISVTMATHEVHKSVL